MNKLVVLVLILTVCLFAATRTEVAKIAVVDTVKTFKVDTVKTTVTDSFEIVKTFKDTSILVKIDTVKIPKAVAKKDTVKAAVVKKDSVKIVPAAPKKK
jgi:hypothetical protein